MARSDINSLRNLRYIRLDAICLRRDMLCGAQGIYIISHGRYAHISHLPSGKYIELRSNISIKSGLLSCFKSTHRLPTTAVVLSGGRSPKSKDLRIIVHLCSKIGAKILRLASLAQEDTLFSTVAASNQQLAKPEFDDGKKALSCVCRTTPSSIIPLSEQRVWNGCGYRWHR